GKLGLEPEIPGDPDSPLMTSTQYLKILSCKADAVVIGQIKNKTAHMTDDEEYIYSEYPLMVAEVLKNNPSAPIQVEKVIEVTRPGGIIELDGRRIRVEDRTYPFLEIIRSY